MQKDLLPLYAPAGQKGGFRKTIAHLAQAEPEQIYGMDLCVYNGEPGRIWGPEGEFVSSGRLDDLECAYALSVRLPEQPAWGECGGTLAYLTNEEVGAAPSRERRLPFLADTFKTDLPGLRIFPEEYRRNWPQASCFPRTMPMRFIRTIRKRRTPVQSSRNERRNCPEIQRFPEVLYRRRISGPVPQPVRNGGGAFPDISEPVGYSGGFHTGNIANTQTPMYTADIGLPQLAMHSCYETAGTKDCAYLEKAAKVFYEASFREEGQAYTASCEKTRRRCPARRISREAAARMSSAQDTR